MDDPTGPPLEDYPDGSEKEAELNQRLQELDNDPVKRALVLKTSHIGGHKYAGNVIVGLPLLLRAQSRVLIDGICTDLHAPRGRYMVWPCVNPRG